jgi:hypothetical protein
MAKIKWDLVEGNSGELTDAGWKFYRTALVSELSGSGPFKLIEAVKSLGVLLGDVHPEYQHAYLISIMPSARGTDIVECRLTYEEFNEENVFFTINSSPIEIMTNVDSAGSDLELSYQYSSSLENTHPDYDMAGKTDSTGAEVSKLTTQPTVIARHRELITGAWILQKIKTYVGKVNNGPFFLDTDAFARQWLCIDISATEIVFDKLYDVSYSFQYSPYTWDSKLVYINPRTGRPPADVTAQEEAYKSFQIYEEVDFNVGIF